MDNLSGRPWSVAKTLVAVTFIAITCYIAFVGPWMFLISFAFLAMAFPFVVMAFVAEHNLPVPSIILSPVILWMLPIIWIASLWRAGDRAWNRDNIWWAVFF